MKCAVCGRTIEELEEEFGNDAEITETGYQQMF